MKRTGFTGYVYDFSVSYNDIAVDNIKNIHEYLIKKNDIVWIYHAQERKCLSCKINNTYKMGIIKQINIKNRTYYFYNDITELENFDSSLFKIDKKSYKDIGIYNMGYITIKKVGDCKNIYSVNPLYLCVNHAPGYIEEKGVNKYLIFDSMELHSIDENKELLKKIQWCF